MSIPFIRARNFTHANRTAADIAVIVIHTMEAPEKPTTAEAVARWFAGRTAPQASAHYCIDNNSIVQGVRDRDVAWAAPGCNHNGIQFEHAGYAQQRPQYWADPYSQEMLKRSARLAARLCRKYHIPIRRVRAAGLRLGRRGITGHVDVSEAFRRSNHTDPGPHFPWAEYLGLVKEAATRLDARR